MDTIIVSIVVVEHFNIYGVGHIDLMDIRC